MAFMNEQTVWPAATSWAILRFAVRFISSWGFLRLLAFTLSSSFVLNVFAVKPQKNTTFRLFLLLEAGCVFLRRKNVLGVHRIFGLYCIYIKIFTYLNDLLSFQNNGKAGYNAGDALKDRATVNNIKENRQLPMVIQTKRFMRWCYL